jgi:hypothetical protein
VDLARRFGSATLRESPLGGIAGELPKDDAAHVFRKNPSDRSKYSEATPGDDYFLEDPYEPLTEDPDAEGSRSARLSLANFDDRDESGEERGAFSIDGDLWILNTNTNSFRLEGSPDAPHVLVIVVQGNIHIADNLYCGRGGEDGIVLVALKDPSRPDSGNILLGDPDDGRLREVDAFLLAEHDVLGCRLGAPGSRRITIRGSVTAGDQVKLQPTAAADHCGLVVNYDDRLLNGRLALPGLAAGIRRASAFTVLSWKETETP